MGSCTEAEIGGHDLFSLAYAIGDACCRLPAKCWPPIILVSWSKAIVQAFKARCVPFLLLGTALVPLPSAAQILLSPEQASARKPPEYRPAYEGQTVMVRGQVALGAHHFLGYTQLAIQDNSGILIDVPGGDLQLDPYRPGDRVEVSGTLLARAGMPVIRPAAIRVLEHAKPPTPLSVSLKDLIGFRYLGRLVQTEGRVSQIGETTGGPYLQMDGPDGTFRLFIPYRPQDPWPGLNGYKTGDKVRATGIASQYCPTPPFNRWFELVVSEPGQIVLTERSSPAPPLVFGGLLALVLLIAVIVWSRERRLRGQRERLRAIYALAEEILGASSAETILLRIREVLPKILGVTRVRLWLHNRAARSLDAVVSGVEDPVAIPLASPPGGTQAGVAACFHYRSLLMIPDTGRSPFPVATQDGSPGPRSLLFVPMMSQSEVSGVLELDQDDRERDFTPDEKALAQHLGNQIGVAIRLLDQRSVQEQLFRTEKLAAVGRLISGVVNELQAPLASIQDLASMALEKSLHSAAERDVSAIVGEAGKARGIVARLVSFAGMERGEARGIDINDLLHNLIEFRERDWKASGIRINDLTSRDPLLVLGSEGQLEQVFLNLLVHAEQALAESPEKTIVIRTSVLAKRLVVEIGFTAPPEARKPEETASVLGVTRSIIAGHGGEVRLIEKPDFELRFEVELPAASRERTGMGAAQAAANAPRDSGRRMTALIIEPDEAAQRQLLALLAARGHRVIPVDNSDTGLDLSSRMRFDVALCSVHAPGLNWVELSERMHSRVGGFVLLSDGFDPELAADFEGDGRFVVPKPIQEEDVDRVLSAIDALAPVAVKNGVAR
jgi:GAF domain-containing protein/CheY-like chemotaxis protein